MFAQARLTPQNPDPAQRTQQKIMQYGMPLMFGVHVVRLPRGPHALHLHEHVPLGAALDLHEQVRQEEPGARREDQGERRPRPRREDSAARAKGAKNANVPKKTAEPVRAITSGDADDTSDDEVDEPAD